MSVDDLPKFKKVKSHPTYANPEELFYKLSGRSKSHGYLRGPQQDVLREYAEKHQALSDLAFELPTGTGKTAVGLLIAEWWRLQSRRAAFLSLTNQLAGQALEEAKRLKISAADVRGTKDSRDPAEEGRYRTGAAIAVTTYSNLFNIKPIIRESDVLIFDDAHGAEQYVADMWTVSASASKQKDLYGSLLAALRPGFSESQVRSILNKSGMGSVEMPDVHAHPECIGNVLALLDTATADSVRYAWPLIRGRIQSCLFLASSHGITVRPLIPPTHTHEAFARAKQRIYMSATLGGASDLQRSYGVEKIDVVRAKSHQWGRRYVFVPGVHTTPEKADEIAAGVWGGLKSRRALLLAPSERLMDSALARLTPLMHPTPHTIGAQHIADTLDGFVKKTDILLALAGRYDGLDLPDDQCRFLIMSNSPAAINSLERHLSERWKMGPVLRTRERTRLTQGMGRCTRSATDFAVIIWLGQSLVDRATSSSLLAGLPPELSAEVSWGVEQSQIAIKTPDGLIGMILGLVHDAEYRKAADEAMAEMPAQKSQEVPSGYETAGLDEVRFAKALWDDNFHHAHAVAHQIADHLTKSELAGYRAWWWYLASRAAFLMKDKSVEQDCLRRGASCGVNAGWLNYLLHERNKTAAYQTNADIELNAEGLWDHIEAWGWAGPAFEQAMKDMLSNLGDIYHVHYHQGLETLGHCFGAATTRTTEQGAPDVIWSFPNDFHVAFEAKTEKKPTSELSKKEVLEAKGHKDWTKSRLCSDVKEAEIRVVVVAPDASLHKVATPFAVGLLCSAPEVVLKLAHAIAEGLRKLRITFGGREFAEAAVEFSAGMRNAKLDIPSLRQGLLSQKLK